MLIGLAAGLIAITFAILAAFLIPAVIEIRKTAIALREFTVNAETELKPVLHELQNTLTELKGLAGEAASRADEIRSFTEALGETGKNLRTINSVVGTVASLLANTSAWAVGAKAAGKMILESLSKKRKEG
jgi:uncharacterized protein YoxC